MHVNEKIVLALKGKRKRIFITRDEFDKARKYYPFFMNGHDAMQPCRLSIGSAKVFIKG